MIEITSQVLTELSEVFNDSTQGKWHKGMTTHHTVCDSAGLKKYPIAEFHHAADAQFCDTAHEFMPLLAEEITRLRATAAQQAERIKEREEKRGNALNLGAEYYGKFLEANRQLAAANALLASKDALIEQARLTTKEIRDGVDQMFADNTGRNCETHYARVADFVNPLSRNLQDAIEAHQGEKND